MKKCVNNSIYYIIKQNSNRYINKNIKYNKLFNKNMIHYKIIVISYK